MAEANVRVCRLVDTMMFRYFYTADLLDQLLQVPDLAVTTPVCGEVHRNWDTRYPDIGRALDRALSEGRLTLCDFDPTDGTEATLHFKYRDIDGFGDGESSMMVLSVARGHPFVSHDLEAAARMRRLGVKVMDWRDLVDEMSEAGLITAQEADRARVRIQSLMRGR